MSDQIKFISTPPTSPPEPSSTKSGVRTTDVSPNRHQYYNKYIYILTQLIVSGNS